MKSKNRALVVRGQANREAKECDIWRVFLETQLERAEIDAADRRSAIQDIHEKTVRALATTYLPEEIWSRRRSYGNFEIVVIVGDNNTKAPARRQEASFNRDGAIITAIVVRRSEATRSDMRGARVYRPKKDVKILPKPRLKKPWKEA